MGKMFAEIGRIVDEDVSNRVNQYNVIYEAITNSIHANATEITCTFKSFDNPYKDENGIEVSTLKVDTITVRDNGDGMNCENYDSFCRYRSEYKKDLGAEGTGRLVFLKVYNFVRYKSRLVALQEERNFKFDRNFDIENIRKTTCEIKSNITEISLTDLSDNYLNRNKHIDRRIKLELDVIKEKVLINLIPTLFFYKKKGINITIEFLDATKSESRAISPSDIPDFESTSFIVEDKERKGYNFTLNYKIENIDGKLRAFYCANNRTVAEFADKDFKFTLPSGYAGFLLLESKYFDEKINNHGFSQQARTPNYECEFAVNTSFLPPSQ